MSETAFSSSAHSLVLRNAEFPQALRYIVVVGADADEDDEDQNVLSKISPIKLTGSDPRDLAPPAPYDSVAVGIFEFLVSSPFGVCGVEEYPDALSGIWQEFDAHSEQAEGAASDAQSNLDPEYLRDLMSVADDEWLDRFAVVVRADIHPEFDEGDVFLAALREIVPLSRPDGALLASLLVSSGASSNHERLRVVDALQGYNRDLPEEGIKVRAGPHHADTTVFRVYAALAGPGCDNPGSPVEISLRYRGSAASG